MGETPFVEIADLPFMETSCAAPDDCPVCQAHRCQFGRLGYLVNPQQPQCQRTAVQYVAGTVKDKTIGWCDEHAPR